MQRGFAPVLLVILVGVLAVIGYSVYQKQNNPSFVQQIPKPSQNLSSEVADWKTYTFDGVGSSVSRFQIKYPKQWDYQAIRAGEPLHLVFYTQSIGNLNRELTDVSGGPQAKGVPIAPIEIQVSIGAGGFRCPCEEVTVAGITSQKNDVRAFGDNRNC